MNKITPCGKIREKVVARVAEKKPSEYVLRAKWEKTTFGTNAYYSAQNDKYRVVVTVGCFGTSNEVMNLKTGKNERTHHLHRDGTLAEWQEVLEKQYLFP